MTRPVQTVLAALAVIGALVVAQECGRRAGARQARLEGERATIDTVIRDVGAAYQDSLKASRRENARLKATIVPRDSIVLTDTVTVYQQLAARDTVILHDSTSILYLTRQVTVRDSLNRVLQGQRDQYRSASRKRLACVGGATAAVGWNGRSALGVGVTCGWKVL